MSRDTELWDDSALLSAFDSAISKYKKMNGKQHFDNSTDTEKVISDKTQCIPAAIDGSPEETERETGPVEEVDERDVKFSYSTKAVEVNGVPPFEENKNENFGAPEPDTHAPNAPPLLEAQDVYTNLGGVDKYNQLLSQYYELEAQRQKVLEQLQQVGNWSYPFPSAGYSYSNQWDTCASATQDPKHQAYSSTPISSCCPYACPCLATQCPSMLTCPFSGCYGGKMSTESAAVVSTNGPEEVAQIEDERVVQTAMKAAEKALTSMKKKSSSDANSDEDKRRGRMEVSGLLEGGMAETMGSETDLTVLLNAWYSAGFLTSKYLMEQSMRKDGKNKRF